MKPRNAALAATLTVAAGALSGCQPSGSLRGSGRMARPPAFQDVSAEWEPGVPGAVQLCDSPRVFVPFDKPVEREVFDVLTAYNTGLDESMERLIAKVIVEESARYRLDPWLVVGLIRVESRFYNFAQSNRDARGLMQIRPFVGQELAETLGISWTGPDSLYNPVKNVKLGVAYLAILHHRFSGNLDKTLTAYNMGPNRVRDWLKAGRELPSGYASLVVDYEGMLARAGADLSPGSDLRSPISEIERRMARRNAVVILPVVADVDPAENGIATGLSVKGLLSPEPEFDAEDVVPKTNGAAQVTAPEPAVPVGSDPEFEAILK